MRVCFIALACSRFTDIDIGYEHNLHGETMRKVRGLFMGMQHAETNPTHLLDGLIAKSDLRELLDLLYDELEASPIGLLT
jgi:hypothetical protein